MPHEKFMFNQNIFDEPEEDEEEFEEPPAPTFSEEELESVRQETYQLAYNKGKEDGLEESRNSRDQKVANVLAKIGEDSRTLFAAEQKREDIFETEVLRLCLKAFQKLFPSFMDKFGEDEFKATLKAIIEKQSGQSKIRVLVSPGTKDGITEFLSGLNIHNNDGNVFEVEEKTDLSEGACQLSWDDGGAIRDIEALSNEMLAVLEEALASKPITGHDGIGIPDSDSTNPEDPDHSDQEPEAKDLGDQNE